MEIYIKLFEVLFPVFFIIGVGYFIGKKKPNLDSTFITDYASNFGAPALFIFAITSSGVTYSIFAEYFVYSLIAIICFSITGIIFLFLMKKDYLRELPPFILPNTGNMGIPLCLFAYGTLGMGVAASISSVVVLLHFTLNIFLASKKFDINIILKSPTSYAVLVAVIFLYFDLDMPKVVLNTVMLLGYTMIVLVLMSLGISLTQLKVFSFKNALISSIGRVIIGPLIGFALIKIFNLSGFAAGTLLIQSSMPSAILTYLIADMYSPKETVDNISSMIVVSTLMSLITVPVVVFFALKYFI